MSFSKLVFSGGEGEVAYAGGKTIFKAASHPENPVIRPWDHGAVWESNGETRVGAIFNGGAEVFGNRVVVTPRFHVGYERHSRVDEKLGITRYWMDRYVSEIHVFLSADGLSFADTGVVIRGDGSEHRDFTYGIEDVRITKVGDTYILIGCGKIKPPFKGGNADRIAVYTTRDFRDISYRGVIRELDSRNAVLIPEPLEGKWYMFVRLHPDIQLVELSHGLDQLLNPSNYPREWIKVREMRERLTIIRAGERPHEAEKVGAGPPPIKTGEGWLFIYHAVGSVEEDIARAYGLKTGVPRAYTVSAALLDPVDPRKVLYRSRYPIYVPNKPWETEGDAEYPVDIPWVVFPMGVVRVGSRLAVYAGAGDKYEVVLTMDIDKLLNYLVNYGERP